MVSIKALGSKCPFIGIFKKSHRLYLYSSTESDSFAKENKDHLTNNGFLIGIGVGCVIMALAVIFLLAIRMRVSWQRQLATDTGNGSFQVCNDNIPMKPCSTEGLEIKYVELIILNFTYKKE